MSNAIFGPDSLTLPCRPSRAGLTVRGGSLDGARCRVLRDGGNERGGVDAGTSVRQLLHRLAAGFSIGAVLFAAAYGQGSESEIAALRQEVRQLREEVQVLRQELKGITAPSRTSPTYAADPAEPLVPDSGGDSAEQ